MRFKKNKNESFTVKTGEHIPIGFELVVYYVEGMRHENKYFLLYWRRIFGYVCLKDG